MEDKQLLYQMIERSIDNALTAISPGLRVFSSSLTNYAVKFIEPYVNAFLNPDTEKLNTKAAGAYLKEETNKKIEEFMKRFEKEQGNV